ncbi:mitochondrial enoyl reductase [Colletotrichum truncatum]|uniref:Mitochondrial enoyl reductase n=1 Tax=Colletotrichum truncatum TaxID=5467 RepID=A0ACC3YYT7_COLTU|nr:mitochondrial enoyl reductase [Colletotrichum truncatum]KAF6781797.1 mitochondrial enoyl reductase [Colletotrichum truncatum]
MSWSIVHQIAKPRLSGIISHEIPDLGEEDEGFVLVKFLAAPINRVDLMVLAGQYPVKPRYLVNEEPVLGFDGCGVIVESKDPSLEPGDVIIPRELGLGTWRTHAVLPARSLLKLPGGTPPLAASLLRSSAVVAWLLLEEVTPLQKGDWIIVSAGTSCVAQFLAQIASRKGINAILVIRDREGVSESKKALLKLGAAKVITESELEVREGELFQENLVLAIDSVFGDVGQRLVETLSPGGKYVLLGMLGGPAGSLAITTKHLFHRRLSLLPFRSSEVLSRLGTANADALFHKIARLLTDGSLKCPDVRIVDWAQGENDHTTLETIVQESLKTAESKDVGYQKLVWNFQ